MNKMRRLGIIALGSALALPAVSYGAHELLNDSPWTDEGLKAIRAAQKLQYTTKERAKNVILFVGDGMGVSTITAARILDGQRKGQPGEENKLSYENFPHLSLVKTYSVNQQTPDSAPTMTAIITGVKTKDGILSINENVVRGDHTTVAGNELTTLLEIAEDQGLATGIVSTARITHATPAATYAHSPERDWESDAELNAAAKAADFPDIARQLIEFKHGDGLEVALGGGREYFLPNTVNDPEDSGATGRRKDGRNLTTEWSAREGSSFVWNKAQFDAVDPATTKHLLGLFERSHMEYEADRAKDTAGEPSLAELTAKAIDVLSKGDKGFFLMVEGGRIDHAHHAGNARRALEDAIALADAVKVATDKTRESDTQILVTADHSHVFTIAGYPARGNDILGKVITLDSKGEIAEGYALDGKGKPYTTLGYANGPGYRGTAERPDLTAVDTEALDFLQEAAVPLSAETHAGEDVALYARGPSSHLLQGGQEQTISFYLMAHALGFDGSRKQPIWNRIGDWF
ncbi:MAG: alkaline phosphatase, placental type [Pseudomonadota bacterium]|jgi:alkaline phosphatase